METAPLIRDIELLASKTTFPEKVLTLLGEARHALAEGDSARANEAAMGAMFALAADPTYEWGDGDVAWLIRASLVSLPPRDLLEEARLLLEEEVTRHQGQRDPWGEPLPEWERYNAAASRAWRLRRQAEGDPCYDSVIAIHRDLDDVIDALLSLLVECEERGKRERIVTIVGAMRLHTK